MKLNKEAIDEIMCLLNEVKDVVRLLGEFGINITSDPWVATSFDSSENILSWNRKDFEKYINIKEGDKFFIGGNIVTGCQHEYKDKWIIAPKKLAETQGDIFEEYLQNIIKTIPLKHFKIKFKDDYGLINNCGWEHNLIIETTVKESALDNTEIIREYLEEISEEWDDCKCIYKALSLVLETDEQLEWESIYHHIISIIQKIDMENEDSAEVIREEILFRKEHPNDEQW